jgi:hypothetical protein
VPVHAYLPFPGRGQNRHAPAIQLVDDLLVGKAEIAQGLAAHHGNPGIHFAVQSRAEARPAAVMRHHQHLGVQLGSLPQQRAKPLDFQVSRDQGKASAPVGQAQRKG